MHGTTRFIETSASEQRFSACLCRSTARPSANQSLSPDALARSAATGPQLRPVSAATSRPARRPEDLVLRLPPKQASSTWDGPAVGPVSSLSPSRIP